ncbi:F-box protein CPR1-like [Apium graveolens]|uniref:F-box protein CPR1-like n=1 Tax=Apium graveolens TaxID=4045 RepID=UPI003D793F72
MGRSKNSIPFLPDELWFKILMFLPVISLLQCKSVCKTWLSIISNPRFVETHLIESLKKQSVLLDVFRNSISIHTDETTIYYRLSKLFRWSFEIVCSCNGLVCISNRATNVIYLGNPMTRRFKKLPPPSDKLDDEYCLLGFGFDDISNDYKILRVSVLYKMEDVDDADDDGYDVLFCVLRAEMYSENDDSWKQIQIPETLEDFPIHDHETMCVNLKGTRILYFEGQDELLSFDLHYEVFKVYPYPESYPMFMPHYLQRKSFLLEFEGSVGLIFNESTNDESVPSLWTLNEVLGNWSWSKEFNLDDLKEIQKFGLYMGDGRFFAHGADEDIFYDYKKKHVKQIDHYAPLLVGKYTGYNETLVSLEGFEQLE